MDALRRDSSLDRLGSAVRHVPTLAILCMHLDRAALSLLHALLPQDANHEHDMVVLAETVELRRYYGGDLQEVLRVDHAANTCVE